MKALVIKLYSRYHQFIRFGVVGLSNFLVSVIVYRIVLAVFGLFPEAHNSSNVIVAFIFGTDGVDYTIANVFAFVISVLNAYILNRLWVFKREAKKTAKGSSLRFYLSYISTFLLTILLSFLWVEFFHISKEVIPFINVIITTPLNFLLSKYFAFREKRLHVEGSEILPYDECDVKGD